MLAKEKVEIIVTHLVGCIVLHLTISLFEKARFEIIKVIGSDCTHY